MKKIEEEKKISRDHKIPQRATTNNGKTATDGYVTYCMKGRHEEITKTFKPLFPTTIHLAHPPEAWETRNKHMKITKY